MRTCPRLIIATAVVAASSLFATSGGVSASHAYVPGQDSELVSSPANPTQAGSCSMSTTMAIGESFGSGGLAVGTTRKFYGVCSFPDTSLVPAKFTETVNLINGGQVQSAEIRIIKNGVNSGFIIANDGPNYYSAYQAIDAAAFTACAGVANCYKYEVIFRKVKDNGSPLTATDRFGLFMSANSGFQVADFMSGVRFTTVRASAPSLGLPDAPPFHFGSPYVVGPPPPVPCGTDATGPLYTGPAAPVPDVPTSSLNLARTGVVQPGSGVNVTYPKPVSEGQVYAKWADEPDTKYRALAPLTGSQSLYLGRPSTAASSALQRDVVFKCVRPANPTPLYSQFVQAQNGGGDGAWAVFTTSDSSRPCGLLTINSLPRAGYVPGTEAVPLYIVSSVAQPLGAIVISYQWSGDSGVFPSQAMTTVDPVTFTIPASDIPDRYYERLFLTCTDAVGKFTLRGSMATNDLDPASTDPFPGEQDLDLCFSATGIGLNPSSWVPSGARMGSCVLRVLFIPGPLDPEALRRRVTGAAGAWAEPVSALAAGVTTLVGTSGSCSYTATLPINGGLDMVFDSCSGHVATGRELVFAASSVSIALFGGLYLKRKAISILTLNSQEAASNAAYVEAARAKSAGRA